MKTQIVCLIIAVLFIFPNVNAFQSRSDNKYLSIAKEIADAHEWKMSYNCHDFSWDLMTKLNREGYLSNIRIGRLYPCTEFSYHHWRCKHEWVEVWVGNNLVSIEPQSGKVLTEKDFKVKYKK